ncbi:MAG: bifunctional DNA-binding transcriptional regulator/O6-methylguanine-DNA methyltransferase Ada [Pseudomonadota bacterium]
MAHALSVLAHEAGYSPSHLQRLFKAIVGLSPKQYAMAHRRGRLGEALRAERSVTDALYQAGYGASPQAYATSSALGMTPSAYRRGAAGEGIRCASAPCSLGTVPVATTERGVCMIEQVVSLIHSPSQASDLPLDIRGTAFQQRVWRALAETPAGQTVRYAKLAARIGHPTAGRAVAQPCARNGLAVAVPCHRVIHASGEASGYKCGDARKRALLDEESTGAKRVPAP